MEQVLPLCSSSSSVFQLNMVFCISIYILELAYKVAQNTLLISDLDCIESVELCEKN